MKYLFIFCGLLWILYGAIFLAINASVSSAPTPVLTLRNIAYLFIGIYFIVGGYLIKTAFHEKRKRTHRYCNRTFHKVMLIKKFKISIHEFCALYNIELEDGIEYINSRLKLTDGILEFNEMGQISVKRLSLKND